MNFLRLTNGRLRSIGNRKTRLIHSLLSLIGISLYVFRVEEIAIQVISADVMLLVFRFRPLHDVLNAPILVQLVDLLFQVTLLNLNLSQIVVDFHDRYSRFGPCNLFLTTLQILVRYLIQGSFFGGSIILVEII